MVTSISAIEKLLENLRTPSGDNVLFENYLKDAWELFGFDDDPNLPAFEAFLIVAISHCFAEADIDSKQAKSRDACLVGLGLLKGCYHTKTKDGVSTHVPVDDRYVSYLQGDYIELMRPLYKKGDNLDPFDRRSKPRQALEKSDARARKRLAKHLAGQAGYNAAYQASIEKHIKPIKSSEEEKRLEFILPEPCYTLEKFSSANQSKPKPESESNPEPDYNHIQKLQNMAIITVFVLLIVLCGIGGWSIYKAFNQQNDFLSISDIFIVNDNITISPGRSEHLDVCVYPPKANLDSIECEPKNKNLVRVEDFSVFVSAWWQEEADHTTLVRVYCKDNPNIYKDATVTVEPPAHISDPSPSGLNHPVLDGTSKKGADSNWNDYTE